MALILLHENIVDEYEDISQQDKASIDALNCLGMNYKASLNMNFISCTAPTSFWQSAQNKQVNNKELNNKTVLTVKSKSEEDILNDKRVVYDNEREKSQVLNAVQINNQKGFATDFVKQMASNQYKSILESAKKPLKRKKCKKTMKELMQQSVFHGKGWMGSNFIA